MAIGDKGVKRGWRTLPRDMKEVFMARGTSLYRVVNG